MTELRACGRTLAHPGSLGPHSPIEPILASCMGAIAATQARLHTSTLVFTPSHRCAEIDATSAAELEIDPTSRDAACGMGAAQNSAHGLPPPEGETAYCPPPVSAAPGLLTPPPPPPASTSRAPPGLPPQPQLRAPPLLMDTLHGAPSSEPPARPATHSPLATLHGPFHAAHPAQPPTPPHDAPASKAEASQIARLASGAHEGNAPELDSPGADALELDGPALDGTNLDQQAVNGPEFCAPRLSAPRLEAPPAPAPRRTALQQLQVRHPRPKHTANIPCEQTATMLPSGLGAQPQLAQRVRYACCSGG